MDRKFKLGTKEIIKGLEFVVSSLIFVIGGILLCVGSMGHFGMPKWTIIPGAIALVLGIAIVGFFVLFVLDLKEYKRLYESTDAFETTATYKKAKYTSYNPTDKINGRRIDPIRYGRVYYTYTDETGKEQKTKSTILLAKNQIIALKDKNTFAIKCKGKKSAIIEDLPEAKRF